MVQLPESVHKVLDVDALCTSFFNGLEWYHTDVSWLNSRAILSTKTSKLIEINA